LKLQRQEQERREQEKKRQEQERLRREKRRAKNKEIRKQIKELKQKKEKLHLEKYAKARVLSGPRRYHRDEETIKVYEQRIRQIDKFMLEIDSELKKLETTIQG